MHGAVRHSLTHKLTAQKPLLHSKNWGWCWSKERREVQSLLTGSCREVGERDQHLDCYSTWQKLFITDEQNEEGAVCSSLAFEDVFCGSMN